jgi:DNA polymerase III epsilon subunit-like protein
MTTVIDPDAVARLWSQLRLIVIDVETAVGSDGHRIISFAAVTCRNDSLGGRFQEFINPGIPIDEHTKRIHKLTDSRIAHEDDFGELAPRIINLLTPRDNETLVVCAHRVAFDIPLLRRELERVDLEIPDLPLLDTSRGLARVAGVRPRSGSLKALLAKLDLTNFAPHDALGDAVATAEAARLLLDLAASSGYDDVAQLLAAAADGTSTTVAYLGPRDDAPPVPTAPERSPAHIASHAYILESEPDPATLARWLAAVSECASLRCDLLVDRVAAAAVPPDDLLGPLLDLVRERAKAKEVGATATLLAVIAPLFVKRAPTDYDRELRQRALKLDTELEKILDPLARCGPSDQCPSCRAGEPCPLDTWRLSLAWCALAGDPKKMARQFFVTSPGSHRKQPYFTMRKTGHVKLADAALRLIHRHSGDIGQVAHADQLADLAWIEGCRDPEIAEAHAIVLAAGGRKADLEAAALVCGTTLPLRNGSTDEAWRLLDIREAQILGQIERQRVRYSDEFDDDGNPIPLRRHQAERPHRIRATRFLRGSVASTAG